MALTKQNNVVSIDHDRDAEDVVVYIHNGDVWHLNFEYTKGGPSSSGIPEDLKP